MSPSAPDAASADGWTNRLELALATLRQRLERHFAEESRWQRARLDWQSQWSHQCAATTGHLSMLEAHLSAGMQPAPRLTVVTPEDAAA